MAYSKSHDSTSPAPGARSSVPARGDGGEGRVLRGLIADALSRALAVHQDRLADATNTQPAGRGGDRGPDEESPQRYIERLIGHPRLHPSVLIEEPDTVSWSIVRAIIKAADIKLFDILLTPDENALADEDGRRDLYRRRLTMLNEWCGRPPSRPSGR